MKAYKFLKFTTLLVLTFTAAAASAQEISVVDVRRNITLSDDDAVYRDFYLNTGEGSQLRKNMVVNVKRKINVKDGSTKSIGEIDTVVGQIKIIHIGSKVSVAREHKLIPRDEEPMLEQIGIMAGDRLDLVGSFIDNAKPGKHKNKSSEAEPANKADEPKTADASAVINPKDGQDPASSREPANQLNTAPATQHPIPVPQI